MNYGGIDPAFRKNGFVMAIADEDQEVAFYQFPYFLDFINWIKTPGNVPEPFFVAVENSNLQPDTFDKRGSKVVVAKRSRDVGKNMGISQCTVDLCKSVFGEDMVLDVSPKAKGKKWANDTFVRSVARSVGHTLPKPRMNQDERDAYKLLFMAINHPKWDKRRRIL